MTKPSFHSADEAWLWCMRFLSKWRVGALSPADESRLADDILRQLDQLYRQRAIDLTQARVLRIWGERGSAPSPHSFSERNDARLWREVMVKLEPRLIIRGIVKKESSGGR